MKVDSEKKCFAWKISATDGSPAAVEAGLKKLKGMFPETKYSVENLKMLQLHVIEKKNLSPELLNFCGNYTVVKVGMFTKHGMEKFAASQAKSLITGRSKRRIIDVKKFLLCDNDNAYKEVTKCYDGHGKEIGTLAATCQFLTRRHCVYSVSCQIKGQGFACPDPLHRFTILHCCNYKCNLFSG
ncbi:uncharacterized protein LOC130636025 [Hydractinia symbiolongicarpus]|uniref:uncharacterized protein LOC130636025 n=1 Tax=Hydractinia symbiolongicarpus TaxID=13093 RepID=UPI00254EDF4A|nr:uncharacterized protein LOC130636025 [Hydractinia symbiolongicarpus]